MLVTASPGRRCPMEGQPHSYITDAAPVEVPSSTYYFRLITDGSLVAVKPDPPAIKKKKKKPVPGPESPVPVETERSDT